MRVVLHGYYRSGSSYRVRAALNYKNIEYSQKPVSLPEGEHRSKAFKAINPQGLVPTISIDGELFSQSPAILELIEELHPSPSLLPDELNARARVRAFCAVIGCDIHPIQNLRVLKKVSTDFNVDEDGRFEWARHWISEGFAALEQIVESQPRDSLFIFGDTPSLAEVYLLPQWYNAERFGVELEAYPHLMAAQKKADSIPAFRAAHPSLQPDAI